VFPTQIEEIVLGVDGLAPHFQIRLTKRDRMDHMTVLVECRANTTDERRAAAAAEIATRVKDGVGVSVGVEILAPESLERSVGKLRRVIDQRTPR
jgi:phenylacetate-CoA ligase